jgi:predicted Zn-ribbon and HTH transcriptional regulator
LRPKYEIADILHRYEHNFLEAHKASAQVLRTLQAIKQCRTSALGGHKRACSECGHTQVNYNSCRNRHCPKCQVVAKQRWIQQRESELLCVAYFHIVFTLPHEFNALVIREPKIIYNALFKASWQTIQTFSKDPKHLDAKPGMTSVLHTWGQSMSLHPHLHCIVPCGGLDEKGEWKLPVKSPKSSKRKSNYLFPKRAMSTVFRAKFMACVREQMPIDQQIAKKVMSKSWVVDARQPFLGPKQVIEYLGRYTHKIAISNHRLVNIDNASVSFKYKDYKANGSNKIMTLKSSEFIRRFCLHILPHGFVRMRHYGILASRNKSVALNKAKAYFGLPKWEKQKMGWEQIAIEKLNYNPNQCPKCKLLTLETVSVIAPKRGPPTNKLKPSNEF